MRVVPLVRSSFATLLLAASALAQTTWHVDASGTPPGTGTPGDPYTSVQHAIAQPTTVDGDTVLVAPGDYREDVDFLGKAIRVQSSHGPTVTFLRGDPQATPPRSVVTFASGETASSVLRGFTVREGPGTLVGGETRGGGIFVDGASPVLRDLVVEENRADRGGGLYAHQSDLSLVDCEFRHNVAVSSGGAMHLGDVGSLFAATRTASVTRFRENRTENGPGGAIYMAGGFRHKSFAGCELVDNRAEGGHPGGAVYSSGAWFGFADSRFVRNVAASGAAVYMLNAYCGVFGGCEFVDNDAIAPSPLFFGGGAIYSGSESCLYILDSVLRGNRASAGGGPSNMFGGAVNAWGTHLWIARSVFAENSSDRDGGAVYFSGDASTYTASIERSTFAGNQAVLGAAIQAFGTCEVTNSIVWDGAGAVSLSAFGSSSVTWSDIQGGHAGVGNIDADPRFWSAADGDYRLLPDSPCIDAGDPTQTDPDGSRIDMGAYPFDPSYCPVPIRYCAAKLSSAGCTPVIGHQGTPSLTGADDFVVEVAQVQSQQPALLFWGPAAAERPFGGGWLCIAPLLVRTPVQNSGGNPAPPSDCSGTASFHFTQSYFAAAGLVVGDQVHVQLWYRDPAHPDGTGVGLSDALRFWICP